LQNSSMRPLSGLNAGSAAFNQFSSEPIRELLWIGTPHVESVRDVYDQVVACSNSVSTRRDLHDALARPCDRADFVIHCREDRHPIDHHAAESIACQLPNSSWIDVLGPMALGVRNRSCSAARSLPFDSLVDEIHRQEQSSIGSEVVACQSVVLLAASAQDAELYRQAVVGLPLAFSWATPSQRSRFCNANLYWWDDSVAPAAVPSEWQDRVHSVDPEGTGIHLWICHGANWDQEQSALAGGIHRVLRKPVRLNALVSPLANGVMGATLGRHAA